MYVNGLSTSLPPAVQLSYLRSVPGLEAVEMTRPGYAIEYDYFPPTQLDPTLELKGIRGLFFAGQINGTTGYEEAAGQGVVAGLNAAARALDLEPVQFKRDEAFIGVLVDDLITRGVDEPYRLFTSRAEFRLLLRQENALRRLYPAALRLGLLEEAEREVAEARLEAEDRALSHARTSVIRPEQANALLEALGESPLEEPVRVADLARRPGIALHRALALAGVEVSGDAGWADVEIKYQGYVTREIDAARRLAEMDSFGLPSDLEYPAMSTLSFESREKLGRIRPTTLGQAGRIPGISPADLQNLVVEVLRRRDVSRETGADGRIVG
jgi:tRNA uridine 5-carboxymethylaminomethyl modification enzyme